LTESGPMLTKSELHPKGWGSEVWIVNNELYCGKVLSIFAGKKCSLHYHEQKTETMLVMSGEVRMRFGFEVEDLSEVEMKPGDVFHIPRGLIHQFEAISDAQIIEFSTQHFENDSYRLVKGD
jgi:uncharacterized RmlC-like cupin family protein